MLRQLADEGNYEISVSGDSMEPTLAQGERIRISSERAPLPGEVGLFVAATGELVVHRLVANIGQRWWFLGDNRVALDDVVPSLLVIGRATHVVRFSTAEPIRRSMGRKRLELLIRSTLSPARVFRAQQWRARHASQ